jgi:hypothetical protein
MVFNATYNNISAMSWWSILLVEETGVPGEPGETGVPGEPGETGVPGEPEYPEKTTDLPTSSHNVVSSIHRLSGIQTHNVGGDRH